MSLSLLTMGAWWQGAQDPIEAQSTTPQIAQTAIPNGKYYLMKMIRRQVAMKQRQAKEKVVISDLLITSPTSMCGACLPISSCIHLSFSSSTHPDADLLSSCSSPCAPQAEHKSPLKVKILRSYKEILADKMAAKHPAGGKSKLKQLAEAKLKKAKVSPLPQSKHTHQQEKHAHTHARTHQV